MPPLLEENLSAIQVYSIVRNQVIVAPVGGVIGLDIKSIDIAIKHSKISKKRRSEVFFQVLTLGNHFTGKAQEDKA